MMDFSPFVSTIAAATSDSDAAGFEVDVVGDDD